MNGTNKAIVGIVYGIALFFGILALALSILEALDSGAASILLLAPHEGEMTLDLGTVAGLDGIMGYYSDFVGLFGDSSILAVILEVVGFILAAAAVFAPWGLIPSAWSKAKPLVIVPIVLLPLYAVWAAVMTVLLIVPFLLVKAVIGAKIRSAARKEVKVHGSAIFAVCPKCKRNFERPRVKCDKCDLVVDYPVPNAFGYRVHTCNNGHDIPCIAGRRAALTTVCPYCGSRIVTKEASPVSIALVGATGAGKTTLMLAAVETISDVARSKTVTVEAVTPGVSKQTVAAKDVVAKTASGELDSECLFLRSLDLSERELVFNDISGTEFEPKEDKVLFEEYYTYSDGIVFVFDPISLEHGGRGATPMDVFESFHSMFTQINGFGPGAVSKIPFAVVASKNDVLNPPLKSADVRDFLIENGQQGFVRVLESVFSEVRYFAASSKGDDCKSAAAPIWWIVGKSDQELATKVPVLSV